MYPLYVIPQKEKNMSIHMPNMETLKLLNYLFIMTLSE